MQAPPSVGTDLHRERENPDDNKEGSGALTVEEFMKDVIQQWKEDKDTIGAGPSSKVISRWYNEFGGDYDDAANKVLGKE